ncbi:MAG: PAS domain S-box protein [Cytophagales bacterium]|nr:MAG: PAS domain S-box protein [Cytophagales bacterium]TAF60081.1 MAG: PAS domain S-box protein [Cytophagales bacterium]
MKKIQLNIKTIATLLNIALMLCLLTLGLAVAYYVNTNQTETHYNQQVIEPSLAHLAEFRLFVSQAEQFSENWLSQRVIDEQYAEDFKQQQKKNFEEFSAQISTCKYQWRKPQLRGEIDSLILQFDQILVFQARISALLPHQKSFKDTSKYQEAQACLEQTIYPLSQNTTQRLKSLVLDLSEENKNNSDTISKTYSKINYLMLVIALVVALGFGLNILFINNFIIKHISYISDALHLLSGGQIPKQTHIREGKNEIDIAYQALGKLVAGLKSTTIFAQKVGTGDYSAKFELLSEQDALGNALIEMRNNLDRIAAEDQKRRWISDGIASFTSIFSQNYSDLRLFSETVIRQLVQYMDANQGAIFLISDASEQEMTLSGFFGWNKTQKLQKSIVAGEGLLGQAWLEKEGYYLTDIPEDYINIGSGLGHAKPTTLLIVPLLLKGEVLGLFELAFFSTLETYKKQFLERVAESFSSTLATVRSNQRTQILLEDSHSLTEQMRSQEEEMRQTIEQMQIAQELAAKKSKNTDALINALNEVVLMIEMNQVGILKQINHNYLNILGYKASELIGQPITTILRRGYEGAKAYIDAWDELARGNPVEGDFERVTKDGLVVYVHGYFFPVMEGAKIDKVIHIAFDITENKNLKNRLLENDMLLHKHQQEIEVLKKTIRQQEKTHAEMVEQINTQPIDGNSVDIKEDIQPIYQNIAELQAQKAELEAALLAANQRNDSYMIQINELLLRLG